MQTILFMQIKIQENTRYSINIPIIMHKTYKNQTKVYLQSNIIKLIKNQLYICQCPIFPLYLQLNGIAFA